MKETKQAAASPEARAALHEVLAAFEGFKAANDQRLAALETKRADVLLEEKVARWELGLKTGRGFYSYPDPPFERPGWLLDQEETDP